MRFEKYQDTGGDWRWRLVAGNGRIVADSSEGYASEHNVDRAINMIQDAANAIVNAAIYDRQPRSAKSKRVGNEKARELGSLITTLGKTRTLKG